jgi:hypothetical protein
LIVCGSLGTHINAFKKIVGPWPTFGFLLFHIVDDDVTILNNGNAKNRYYIPYPQNKQK